MENIIMNMYWDVRQCPVKTDIPDCLIIIA